MSLSRLSADTGWKHGHLPPVAGRFHSLRHDQNGRPVQRISLLIFSGFICITFVHLGPAQLLPPHRGGARFRQGVHSGQVRMDVQPSAETRRPLGRLPGGRVSCRWIDFNEIQLTFGAIGRDLDIIPVEGRAPEPILGIGVRQNGKLIGSDLNVQPGTLLQMDVYLDPNSTSTYGLRVSYMDVTDRRTKEETIILNGSVLINFLQGIWEKWKLTFVKLKGLCTFCLVSPKPRDLRVWNFEGK